MKCPKCEGTMSFEHFIDVYKGGPSWGYDGWRCIHCGAVIDPVILQNRQKSKTRKEIEEELAAVLKAA